METFKHLDHISEENKGSASGGGAGQIEYAIEEEAKEAPDER